MNINEKLDIIEKHAKELGFRLIKLLIPQLLFALTCTQSFNLQML